MVSEGERRLLLREWLHKRVDGAAAVDLPDVTNLAVEHFQGDEEFVRSLMVDNLRPLIYEMARRMLGRTRQEGVVLVGDELMGRSEFEQEARRRFVPKFARWMEHAGDRHVNFMQMDREDLDKAATERERRAQTELALARFMRKRRSEMKPEQKVADVWSAEQLEQLWEDENSPEEAA